MVSDPAKPGQVSDHLSLILPLLLQSALTGKQIDTGELLAVLLTGKPVVSPGLVTTPSPQPQPQPQPAPQAPSDFITLLLPLLLERLTGKPGVTPADPQKKPDAPDTPAQPATSRPSVQLSAGALGISTILQALGVVGTPFGMGPTPTTTGTLATIIPIVTGVLGMSGGFGSLLNVGRALLGGFAGAAGKPK